MESLLIAIGLAVGKEAIGNDAIVKWINISADIIRANKNVEAKIEALRAHILEMVQAGREPTDGEWAALRTRSDLASDRIQSAARGQAPE